MSCCKWSCQALAVAASVVIGIVTAFLQITGIITVTVPFLWVTFGIAVGYLALLVFVTAVGRTCCGSPNVPLAGVLGTTLFSVILLAAGVTATSVISAIFSGLLLLFFSLIITGSACYVQCLSDCDE